MQMVTAQKCSINQSKQMPMSTPLPHLQPKCGQVFRDCFRNEIEFMVVDNRSFWFWWSPRKASPVCTFRLYEHQGVSVDKFDSKFPSGRPPKKHLKKFRLRCQSRTSPILTPITCIVSFHLSCHYPFHSYTMLQNTLNKYWSPKVGNVRIG